MCGLRIFDGPPIYHLPSNVMSATVGFAYIIILSVLTCSPNTSFLARLVSGFGQFRKFEKNLSWGHRPLQPTLRKKFLHGLWVFVHGYLHVRYDLPSSINYSPLIVLESRCLILYRFRQVQRRYIWLLLLRLTSDDLRKILHDGQRMATVKMAWKQSRKFQPAKTLQTTDRWQTTDGIATANTRT